MCNFELMDLQIKENEKQVRYSYLLHCNESPQSVVT